MSNQKHDVKKRKLLKLIGGLVIVGGAIVTWLGLERSLINRQSDVTQNGATVPGKRLFLPLPRFKSNVRLEEAIAWRRSIREYKDEPITIENLSMLLWAAQGLTEFKYGFRTAPSAGGTYPIEIYVSVSENGVLVNEVEYLPSGSYKYYCLDHSLRLIKSGDIREDLAKASLNQEWVRKAPLSFVVFADYGRTMKVYGQRGEQYVHMEDGHVGQNIYLMATALNLGAVVIGAFHDDHVKSTMGATGNEQPLYVIPIGVPKELYRITEEDLAEHFKKARSFE
ncbi:MAG: SagB/ThcOx family dehydrogenase [Nitrososphaeria archaeon]